MSNEILISKTPITLLGGGEATRKTLDAALNHASTVAAADGGAKVAVLNGIRPQAVIGDFDSLDDETRSQLEPDTLHQISEQDSTDFDKALRNIRAPLVVGVGFLGGRLDHQLAAFNTLTAHPDKPCILIDETDIVFLAPPELRLSLPSDCVFSLFPMGRVLGRSTGLCWPIDGIEFNPDGRVGTSNKVCGPVELEMSDPRMLVIVPVEALNEVVQELTTSDARWPSRAG